MENDDMEMNRDLFDYELIDARGSRVGTVSGLWADDATGKPEFAAVKTGWIFGRNHLVPIREGQIDEQRRAIRVPYNVDAIRDAPNFAMDHDLSPDEEERVYAHYHLSRTLNESPTGLPREDYAGAPPTTGDLGERAAEMTLREERAHVGKRMVEDGGLRLRKIVRTEVVNQPVELKREHYEVERVPPSEIRASELGRPFEQEEVVLREHHEEPVVEKSTEIVGGVRARKEVDTQRENVETEIRREDVEIDRDERERRP